MRQEKHTPPPQYNPRLEPPRKAQFCGYHDIPLASISVGTTLVFPTGGWRSSRPVYEERIPPCVPACPAGVNIEQCLVLAGQGRFEEAAELLRRDNPLPATTGRVCYHPCQADCNRRDLDAAIQIQAIERFIGDLALRIPLSVPAKRNGRRVAVIGSGPAGLSFAYQALRAGVQPAVFEREETAGGMPATGIPGYRLPKDVLAAELALLSAAGVEFRLGAAVGRDIAFEELRRRYDAVFIACGFHKPRAAGLAGADAAGVLDGLRFLYNLNRQSPDDIGRRVLVVGGGNTALDAARSALRLGAHVTVLYRRTRELMPAIAEEIEEAEAEGVRLQCLVQPVAVLATNGRVRGVRCQRMSLAEPDASGRRRPVPVPGSERSIECDTVMLATGEEADLSFLDASITVFADGRVSDAAGALLPGVLAGGDLVSARKTVVHAIGSGKRAFQAVAAYLAGQPWEKALDALASGVHSLGLADTLAGRPHSTEVARLDALNPADVASRPANPPPRSSPGRRSAYMTAESGHAGRRLAVGESRFAAATAPRDFRETTGTYSAGAAQDEAARCLHCGICDLCRRCFAYCPDSSVRPRQDGQGFEIDYEYCKGCGICVEECPCGAMKMLWEEK